MTLHRFLRHALGVFAVAALAIAPACKKGPEEPKEMQDIAQKVGQLDKESQKLQAAGQEQARRLREAGVQDIQPGTETMQLTEEQKKVLEERIKNEKNSSYQALLQDVIDRDKEIKELNEKINKLRAVLPKPDLAREGDSHYAKALRFLRNKGISEAEAKRLVARVNIMERIVPGFEIYHFYNNGVYGTWVSQGKAKISPSDLIREDRERIEGERDTAVAQGEVLREEVADLMAQKQAITAEIESLRVEKTKLIEDLNTQTAIAEDQKAKLNSLHYLVGDRKQLEKDGIIIVPVFAKDRAGKAWRDEVFTNRLDLRSQEAIEIKASALGLKKVGKVSVVPGSILKDEHYKLELSEDKQTATIKILAKERFRNEKVVFAVTD